MFSKVHTSRDGVSTTFLSNLCQGHGEFLPNIKHKFTLFAFKHADVGPFGLHPLLWSKSRQHGTHTCWEQGTLVSLHCRKMGILVPAPALADTFLSSHSFSPWSSHCVWQHLKKATKASDGEPHSISSFPLSLHFFYRETETQPQTDLGLRSCICRFKQQLEGFHISVAGLITMF